MRERTGQEFRIRHHAFELNPKMPTAGMDRRTYRSEKFGSWERSCQLDAGTVPAGRDEGIGFNYEAINRTPNTRAGHRLIALAERQAQSGAAMADRRQRRGSRGGPWRGRGRVSGGPWTG